jgi:hypothetical protein
MGVATLAHALRSCACALRVEIRSGCWVPSRCADGHSLFAESAANLSELSFCRGSLTVSNDSERSECGGRAARILIVTAATHS